jgi:beta-glucosidase/6-phospho-beta-glucosidase/beta-galactosidase
MEIDIARTIARYIFGNDQALELVPLATTKRISSLRSVFRFMDPVLKGWGLFTSSVNTNWWQLGMAGKLSSFLCPSECVGQMDYVGFDYYWGISSLSITRILGLVEALVAGRTEKAPVYPKGLYNWLKEYGKQFPKLPILIIENGCVSVADKIERATYISLHLKEVQRAISDGVNVVAYICWSITSNRELGHPFAPDTDFGLYHIDLDTDPLLARQPTSSAEIYANIIANRNVPD